METLQLGAVDLVKRPGVRGREQRQRGLAVSGQLFRGGRLERPACPPSRLCRKRRGALQKGGGGRKSSSGARTLGRLLELVRDVVVGPGGGMSAVPHAAIGIEFGVGGGCERLMRGSALLGRRRAIGRRAQERVAKRDLQAEL